MSPSPPAHDDVLDLCSDEEQPPERQYKRHRREEVKQSLKQQEQIIDLSMSSPEGWTPPVAGRDRSRQLWGEVETEGPPRWNHARRRSSLAPTASNVLPEMTPQVNDRDGLGSVQEEPHITKQEQQDHSQAHQQWLRNRGPSGRYSCTLRSHADTTDHSGVASPARSRPVAVQSQPEPARAQQGYVPPNTDAELRERRRERELAAALRRGQRQARRHEERELSRRIDELEDLEALEEMQEEAFRRAAAHIRPTSPSDLPALVNPYQPRQGYRGGGRRQAGSWAPANLAQAMMGMLSDGNSLAHVQISALSQHVAAVRHAMGALHGPGRLPAHLLFSDRDFDENDYEALLALDDNVVSRKGASPEEIDAIPTVMYSKRRSGSDVDCRCPICLEDIEQGAVLRKLTCKHKFHKECLDKWLTQKSVCPICLQQP